MNDLLENAARAGGDAEAETGYPDGHSEENRAAARDLARAGLTLGGMSDFSSRRRSSKVMTVRQKQLQ